jgi:hypothetical protein
MPTLTYSGEQNVGVQEIQTLFSQLVTTHQQVNDISVRSVSVRLRDDGSLRVIVSMEAAGDLGELDSSENSLAQKAADLGFENSTDPADGITLL